jgi:hypothetical protein
VSGFGGFYTFVEYSYYSFGVSSFSTAIIYNFGADYCPFIYNFLFRVFNDLGVTGDSD